MCGYIKMFLNGNRNKYYMWIRDRIDNVVYDSWVNFRKIKGIIIIFYVDRFIIRKWFKKYFIIK